MTILQIKKEMLNWKDFYGGDIPDTEAINNAKTKKELAAILSQHEDLLENMARDASSSVERFRKKLGLIYV